MQLNSYLSYVTLGQIQIRQIEKQSERFSRCQKALRERSDGMSNIEGPMALLEAFKIENKLLLGEFEKYNKAI